MDSRQYIDDHLASASPEARASLKALRETIKRLIPDAEEAVSYGVPAFKLNGKPIVGFAAYKNHCSYFPMSGKVVELLASKLTDYKTSAGTIQFDPKKPLPESLVKSLLEATIEVNAEKERRKKAKK